MQSRPLSRGYRPVPPLRLRRTTIDSASAHRAPGKGERPSPPPRAVAPAMPCHPPHRPSGTTPMQTHRPWPGSKRARKRSAVPTRFSGGTTTRTKWAPAGQPAKSSPPLPRCQLARMGGQHWRRSPGAPSPRDHDAPGPSTSGLGRPPPARVIRSPPMLSTGKGQGSLESHPGTWDRAPAPTDDYLAPRPSISPSAAKAHVRLIQPTGDGSSTSRGGPRAPVMPVAAP
jgi:hypothetical protein